MATTAFNNDTNDDSDTARANRTWADVPNNKHNASTRMELNTHPTTTRIIEDQDTILSPTIVRNPNQSLSVIGMHLGFRKYWRKYGSRFTFVWKGMEESSRKNLLSNNIQRCSPKIEIIDTKSAEEQEQELAFLLPALFHNNASEELWKSENALIQMIQSIVDTDLNVLYFNDAQMIRKLIKEDKLQPEVSKQNLFSLLTGGEHVGQTMEVNTDRIAELGEDIIEKMSHMVKQGWAIEGETWAFVIIRRYLMLQILGLTLDEMRNHVFGQDESKCSLPSCDNTFRQGNDGKKLPLLVCSRCGVSCYCSRDCQVSHWKRHKRECHGNRKEHTKK